MCAPRSTDAVTAAAVAQTRCSARRVANRRREKRLARRPAEDRIAQGVEARQTCERGKGVLGALGEPEAGIEHDPVSRDAGRDGRRRPFVQLARDVRHDVPVLRARVHVRRAPAVVHQDHRGAAAGDDAGKRRVVRQRADVVDDLGAQVERAFGHAGLVRVDRDGHVDAPAQPFEHRRHAAKLLVRVGVARPPAAWTRRRRPADPHQRRPSESRRQSRCRDRSGRRRLQTNPA